MHWPLAIGITLSLCTTISATAECPPLRGVIPTDNVERSIREFGPGFWFAVQRSLDQFGDLPIDVDGSNGPGTQAALRAFQRVHELPGTGTINTETLAVFGELWREQATVPLFAPTSDPATFTPDFTAEATAQNGICRITLKWQDDSKTLELALKTPVKACRLSEFNGIPSYVQSGPVIGVMLDMKAQGYNQPSTGPFVAPVVAVYPDRKAQLFSRQYENYGWRPVNLGFVPAFPDWEGPYDNKGFDFHLVNVKSAHWYLGNEGWMFRPWDMSDCGDAP